MTFERTLDGVLAGGRFVMSELKPKPWPESGFDTIPMVGWFYYHSEGYTEPWGPFPSEHEAREHARRLYR
jgi:hypothetical protein